MKKTNKRFILAIAVGILVMLLVIGFMGKLFEISGGEFTVTNNTYVPTTTQTQTSFVPAESIFVVYAFVIGIFLIFGYVMYREARGLFRKK
jgi:ABC-type Na+ efflux pump permease subunit